MTNLRTIRLAKGLTLQDLSKEIGVRYNTICQWEIGTREPEVKYIVMLANYFNVSTDYILDSDINIVNDDMYYPIIKKLSKVDKDKLNEVYIFLDSLTKNQNSDKK
ncbi:MAG: helix-turn-helix domain-containing protein [Coprobacillus sp.]|nr:helix-turn-helix domain-containing protein [Coprobacillus sp.]MDY4144919.1 helix-turn-helix transcriptional regulator [Bacilli bacterium]